MILMASAAMFMIADNAFAQFKFGAGYSNSTHRLNMGSESSYTLHGFNVGATYDLNFVSGNFVDFGMIVGVNYEYLTDSDGNEVLGVKTNKKVTEHYINTPLQLNLGVNVVPGIFGAYVFGGPSLAFGLASNTEYTMDSSLGKGVLKYNNYTGKVNSDNIPDDMSSAFGGEATDYGWFDVKMGLGVGIELIDSIDLKAGYNWGLCNRYTGDNKGYKHHNDQFYVTLSYIF